MGVGGRVGGEWEGLALGGVEVKVDVEVGWNQARRRGGEGRGGWVGWEEMGRGWGGVGLGGGGAVEGRYHQWLDV